MLAYLIPSFVFLLKKSSSDATLVYQYKTPARDGCYFYASRTIMSNWQIFWQEPIFQTTKFFCGCLSAVQRRREWSPFLESQSNHNLMNHFLQIRQFSIYTKPYLTALFSCRQKNQPKGCSEALAQKSWRLVLVDSLRLLFLQAFSWGGPLMDTAFSAFVRKQKASFLQFLHFFAVAARLATTNEGKKRGGGRSYSTPIALVEWTTI